MSAQRDRAGRDGEHRPSMRKKEDTVKKLIAIVAVTAAVLTMLVAGQSPVSAHKYTVFHGPAGNENKSKYDHATVGNEHSRLWVCDREKDGHRVEAWVWTPSAGPSGPFVDKDGSKGGCSSYDLKKEVGRSAWRLAVCENTVSCSDYHTV